MPQSRTRYQRAAMRSRYRKPKRKRGGSLGWNALIAVVVILGVVAVVLTRGTDESGGAPRVANADTNTPGDHWHTYLAVDICGEWLGNAPPFEQAAGSSSTSSNVGIHSHGDGLIHTHPFVSAEAGGNATIGKFLKYGGWGMSEDSVTAWAGPASKPAQKNWSNGDTCSFGEFKGKKVQLVWKVDDKLRTGNPSDYHQKDGQTVAVYMVPKGAATPFPPDACHALENIGDLNGAASVDKQSPCAKLPTSTTPPASTAAPVSTEPVTTAPGTTSP